MDLLLFVFGALTFLLGLVVEPTPAVELLGILMMAKSAGVKLPI